MSAIRRGTAPPVPERVAALDRLLVELGRVPHRLVYALARAASDLERTSAWTVFGYRTRDEFARAVLGRSGRYLRDLAALQEKMEALPALGRAVGGLDGGPPIGRVAALWIGRVATPENVDRWIDRARRLTLQQLRSAVEAAAVEAGATESQAASVTETAETEAEKEKFTVDLTPDELLAVAEAQDHLGAVMGRPVSQAEFFEMLLAEATSGPWNPEFTPKPRIRPAAASHLGRDFEAVAPRTQPPAESSEPSRIDLEPKTTAERKALRTLKRMREVTWDLLQATRRVSETRAPEARAPESRALKVIEAIRAQEAPEARAPEARAPEVSAQEISALEASVPEVSALEASAPETRPLEAWEQAVRALEAGAHEPLNPGVTSSPPDSGTLRIREVMRIVYRMRDLVHLENEVEIRIADLLLELLDRRPWRCLGYASLAAYAEGRIGLGRTAAHGRVRLARGLRGLPEVRAAYEVGRITMEEAGWIVRYLRSAPRNAAHEVDAALQEAGNEHAETTTLKRLGDERRMLEEKELTDLIALAREMSKRRAGRGRSQSAGDAGAPDETAAVGPCPRAAGEASSPEAARSVERSPETQDAQRPGPALFPDDAMWFALQRREPGQARSRVIGFGHGQLERVAHRGALLERPCSWLLPPDLDARLRATLGVARQDLSRRAQLHADKITPAQEARLLPTERIALEYHRRGQPLRRGTALLALVEEFVRVWDDPAGMTRRPLDAIHNRTGWRCTAPGCTARRNLHVHHICYRSRGGGNPDRNLISVCAFHHLQGEHGRYARCRGRAPLDVVWRLGVAELNIWYRNERRIRPPAEFVRA